MVKKLFIILLVLATIVGLVYYILSINTSHDVIILEYKDEFPVDLIKTYSNEAYRSDNKWCMYIYLSRHCSTCNNDFQAFERIYKIFKHNDFNVKFLWEESDIPSMVVNKYGIDKEDALYIDDVRLGSSVPRFFIVDDNNKVFFSDNDIKTTIRKLTSIEIYNEELSTENAVQYIKDKYVSDNKKNMIYFSMEGCPDCERAEPVIGQYCC